MSINSEVFPNSSIIHEETDCLLGNLNNSTPLLNYGINDVLNPGITQPNFAVKNINNPSDSLQANSINDINDNHPIMASGSHSHNDVSGLPSNAFELSNVANDTIAQPVSDLPNYLDALLPASRPRWNSSSPFGTSVTLTFSFMESRPSYAPDSWTDFNSFTATQRAFARQALQLYANVANINFVEVADTGGGGTIRFGYASRSGANGWAYYPSSAASGGDVWINNFASNLTPGTWYFGTLLHEIGHALGLKHPHDESVNLPSSQDSYKYSNMSYSQHPDMPGVRPQTPQLFDVAAIQYLYGANTSTRTGNNTYSWATNASFLETIWDGGGTDTISAANQTRNAFINLNAGSFSSIGARGAAAAKDNVAIAYGVMIENATGGSGNDTIYGNGVANFLIGGDGNDYLWGADGNDTLYGENGDDTLSGGDGNDYLWSSNGNDYLYGSDGNDTLYSGEGDDYLWGGNGDDYLWSSNRNDTLYGSDGNDTLYSGEGNDYLSGGDGNDSLYDWGGNSSLYGGNGNDDLSGGDGNDSLYGENGDDTLRSGDGDDYLDGGTGNNTMYGSAGNDRYIVDSTGDTVTEYANQGTDTVYSSISYTLGDNIENLIFTGDSITIATGNSLDNAITGNSGINVLSGGAGNDTLQGEWGNDNLDGGEGNDLLIGGSGYDILTGGLGADTFAFNSTGEGFDILTDFTISQGDLIQLSASSFGGGLSASVLAATQFYIGSAATTSEQRIIYDSSIGGLFFDIDGTGATAQVQFAALSTGLTVTSNNFIVVA